MNKLYRNPAAWFSVAMFAGLSYFFFRSYPAIAGVLYGSVIFCIVFGFLRSAWCLRKHGYRIRWHGRDSFYYEELSAGQIRRLMIYAELMARGPRHVYFPNPDEWPQEMPDWARERRDEILSRIRNDLGTKRFNYYDTKPQATQDQR